MIEKSLLGVWRLVSLTSRAGRVHTGQTHLVVREGELWEIWPRSVHYDDRPSPVRAYTLAWQRDDGLLEIEHPGRPKECGIARLFGDELQVRWGDVAGEPPDRFEDDQGTLAVFEREREPATITKLLEPPVRVARLRRSHPVLGELSYDASLEWWESEVRFGGVDAVKLHVDGGSDAPNEVFDRAADLLARVDADRLRAYAASALYELYDTTWRSDEGPDVDEVGFAALLSPESFGVRADGSVSVFFEDGDLFWGHVVIVSLDEQLVPIDAEMAG